MKNLCYRWHKLFLIVLFDHITAEYLYISKDRFVLSWITKVAKKCINKKGSPKFLTSLKKYFTITEFKNAHTYTCACAHTHTNTQVFKYLKSNI